MVGCCGSGIEQRCVGCGKPYRSKECCQSQSTSDLTIRRARKAGPCANRRAGEVGNAKGCKLRIEVGDQYAEGEFDIDNAGGFGRDRICMGCVEAGDA